jgi:multiple antibiotic resistance protein
VEELEQSLTSFGVTFAALFPIVDPIGNVGAFLALTPGADAAERRRLARRACVAMVGILFVFLLIGHFVLDFFDISLAAIEVVGGLVVGYTGWQMLTGTLDDPEAEGEDVSLAPLAFPLLAGPGAIGVLFGLGNRADSAFDYPGYVAGILAIAALTYLAFSHAHRVHDAIGSRGIAVLNQVMGLLVLAIAAELMFHGIADHFGLELVED